MKMNGDKCRSKAMKQAVLAEGVTSVEIQGADKDEMVVIGHEIDAVRLTRLMRKKVGYTTIVSAAPAEEKDKDESKNEQKEPTPIQSGSSINIHYPQYTIPEVVYDPKPARCSIM